jgi:hypothetical protein
VSLFRRATRPSPPDRDEPAEAPEPAAEPAVDPGEAARRHSGPFDVSEVDGSEGRVDLGALWVPARQGMELRLDVEPGQEGARRVVAATIGLRGSTLQLQAFAAPRTEGIWDDIRSDIAASVERQGGRCEVVEGTFGDELVAQLPTRRPDGTAAVQPARFVGVDGPRWFLRGVFSGPAATQPDQAGALEEVLRGVVVVRGSEAMAPRELLELQLPEGATPPAAPSPAAPPAAAPPAAAPPAAAPPAAAPPAAAPPPAAGTPPAATPSPDSGPGPA